MANDHRGQRQEDAQLGNDGDGALSDDALEAVTGGVIAGPDGRTCTDPPVAPGDQAKPLVPEISPF